MTNQIFFGGCNFAKISRMVSYFVRKLHFVTNYAYTYAAARIEVQRMVANSDE